MSNIKKFICLYLIVIPIIVFAQTPSSESNKIQTTKVQDNDYILKIFPGQNNVNGVAIEYLSSGSLVDSLTINGMYLDLNPIDTIVTIPGGMMISIVAAYFFAIENPFDQSIPDSLEVRSDKIAINKVNGVSFSTWNFDFMSTDDFYKDINGLDINLSYSTNQKVNGVSLSTFACPNTKLNGLVVSGLFNYGDQTNGLAISIFKNFSVKARGVQIALFNTSYDFKGVQIGLWNVNNARTLPVFNWNFH